MARIIVGQVDANSPDITVGYSHMCVVESAWEGALSFGALGLLAVLHGSHHSDFARPFPVDSAHLDELARAGHLTWSQPGQHANVVLQRPPA